VARPRFYFQSEYVLWSIRGNKLPPLVTQGSAADPVPGAIGQANTRVLFGNRSVDGGPYSGLRLLVGGWFTDDNSCGMEVGGFGLGSRSKNFTATSFGTPLLARPLQGVSIGLGSLPTDTTTLLSGNALTAFVNSGGTVLPSFAIPGAETTELVAGV